MAQSPTVPISVQQIANALFNDTTNALRISAIPAAVSFTYLTTSGGQNLIKSGAGQLVGVVVGNPLVSAIQAWDNTVSGGTTIFKFAANTSANAFSIPAGFSTGLTLSAGSLLDNITILYI